MSAVAGREAGAVGGWASLPSLEHGVPPSGHGACTALAAAWGKERPGQEGQESCPIFGLQNQTKPFFLSGRYSQCVWASGSWEAVVAKSWLWDPRRWKSESSLLLFDILIYLRPL